MSPRPTSKPLHGSSIPAAPTYRQKFAPLSILYASDFATTRSKGTRRQIHASCSCALCARVVPTALFFFFAAPSKAPTTPSEKIDMNVKQSVALVTGANRGIGRALVDALLSANAAKVYASARSLQKLNG